jgi:hypothetical protein
MPVTDQNLADSIADVAKVVGVLSATKVLMALDELAPSDTDVKQG